MIKNVLIFSPVSFGTNLGERWVGMEGVKIKGQSSRIGRGHEGRVDRGHFGSEESMHAEQHPLQILTLQLLQHGRRKRRKTPVALAH